MEDMMVIALPKGQEDKLKAHIRTVRGNSVSLNAWISEAIDEKMQTEQSEFEKLPDGRKWYRSEEGREAIKGLSESRNEEGRRLGAVGGGCGCGDKHLADGAAGVGL